MAAVRAMGGPCLRVLALDIIGSDAHILDVLPTMWPTALALFQQAAASPAAVMDGTLELIVDG
eukprot:5676609-Pleurochrysis_carterae.AAC.1